jgi:hypothetical protein
MMEIRSPTGFRLLSLAFDPDLAVARVCDNPERVKVPVANRFANDKAKTKCALRVWKDALARMKDLPDIESFEPSHKRK